MLFKLCEICKKPKLWFFISHREMKPNEFMPLIKSKDKMCGKCFKVARGYNFKNGK